MHQRANRTTCQGIPFSAMSDFEVEKKQENAVCENLEPCDKPGLYRCQDCPSVLCLVHSQSHTSEFWRHRVYPISLALRDVLYNSVYGGFGFSDEFTTIFTKRHGKHPRSSQSARADPDILALVHEIGLDRSKQERHCRLCIARVPAEMIEYYRINEYDGMESVTIDYDRAHRDLLQQFIDEKISKRELQAKHKRLLEIESCYGMESGC